MLDLMAEIATREHEFSGNLTALEAKLGRPLANTRAVTVRDGVAIIPIAGPLMKRASFFDAISGAVSYAAIAQDLTAALEDPGVRGVMLSIDSPGGQVDGLSDLVAMVRGASKPVYAHTDGSMASAAYWLGSAAAKIYASDTAIIGSIGVVMGMREKEPKAGEKTYKFISSQSPMKHASPATKEGAGSIQATVDDMAQVFIDAVAINRGTTAEAVVSGFGRGDTMIASKAAAAGIIDSVANFEAALSAIKQELSGMNYEDLTAQALAEKRPDIVSAIRTEALASVEKVDAEAIKTAAVTAERQRMTAIDALAMPGAEKIVADCKADGTTTEAAAMKIVKHMQTVGAETGNTALANIKKAESDMEPPVAAENGGAATDGDKIEADMAALRKAGVVR